jgi:hypothetical protein
MMAETRTRYHEAVLRRTALLVLAANVLAACAALESWDHYSGGTRIAFVQGKTVATPLDMNDPNGNNLPADSLSLSLDGVEKRGDLLVVVVGWYDEKTSIKTIADTAKNTYVKALEPTKYGVMDCPMTQVIYYAKNIAQAGAGTNTITVTFDGLADNPDMRVLEYTGVTTLDVTAAKTGDSPTASSGPVDTKATPTLLVSAITTSSEFANASFPFVLRVVSEQANLVEDRIVDKPGSYTAEATQQEGDEGTAFVMQSVAFH